MVLINETSISGAIQGVQVDGSNAQTCTAPRLRVDGLPLEAEHLSRESHDADVYILGWAVPGDTPQNGRIALTLGFKKQFPVMNCIQCPHHA